MVPLPTGVIAVVTDVRLYAQVRTYRDGQAVSDERTEISAAHVPPNAVRQLVAGAVECDRVAFVDDDGEGKALTDAEKPPVVPATPPEAGLRCPVCEREKWGNYCDECGTKL